ncbi:cation diffusion facilitator family transporter [Paenibacillus sp. HJL G12]|uniref:Cation diffusion facilitator family transporter n=1 Tax=Paenibacillus dendrobii TaxID=2691084 RepID=A0A7X3IGA6_9BACL|nr:cation diffusion facilitator family transporter [Paenibacillus dendrobii]MWV43404.1 cation diffusion facilitator family transporter [Paenibacillus dendrobii]
MSASHSHHHSHEGHGHHHGPANYNGAFLIGIVLNTVFVIVEAAYGYLSHSLSLVADAGHNLSDVLALVLAWAASILSKKVPTERRTYGYRRSSILAALFNAIFLLAAIFIIAWEAIRRFADPEPVTGSTVIWVAAIGIAINAATALLFVSGRKGDLNVRGAFLHMAADAGVSLGVVIAGILIMFTGWQWLDPVVSLLIVLVIFISTWNLLKDSLNMALDSVPPEIDAAAIRAYLASIPSVTDVHDLHIWGMSTTETALTAHLVVSEPESNDRIIQQATHELHERFGIEHPTLQIEYGSFPCRLAGESTI